MRIYIESIVRINVLLVEKCHTAACAPNALRVIVNKNIQPI